MVFFEEGPDQGAGVDLGNRAGLVGAGPGVTTGAGLIELDFSAVFAVRPLVEGSTL